MERKVEKMELYFSIQPYSMRHDKIISARVLCPSYVRDVENTVINLHPKDKIATSAMMFCRRHRKKEKL